MTRTMSGSVKMGETAEAKSNASNKDLIQRKLLFMKMMLRNEQRANKMIQKKINDIKGSVGEKNSVDGSETGKKSIFKK